MASCVLAVLSLLCVLASGEESKAGSSVNGDALDTGSPLNEEVFNSGGFGNGEPLDVGSLLNGASFRKRSLLNSEPHNTANPLNDEAFKKGSSLNGKPHNTESPRNDDAFNTGSPLNGKSLNKGGFVNGEPLNTGNPLNDEPLNTESPLNGELLNTKIPLHNEAMNTGSHLYHEEWRYASNQNKLKNNLNRKGGEPDGDQKSLTVDMGGHPNSDTLDANSIYDKLPDFSKLKNNQNLRGSVQEQDHEPTNFSTGSHHNRDAFNTTSRLSDEGRGHVPDLNKPKYSQNHDDREQDQGHEHINTKTRSPFYSETLRMSELHEYMPKQNRLKENPNLEGKKQKQGYRSLRVKTENPLYDIFDTGNPLYGKMHGYLSNRPNDKGNLEGMEEEQRYGPLTSRVGSLQQGANWTSRTGSGLQGTIHSVVVEGKFGLPLIQNINKTFEYLFEFIYNTSQLETEAVRVTVKSPKSDYTYPLLVVVRQQRGVLSWQLPLEPPPNTRILDKYHTVSHTLCPVKNYKASYQGNLDSTQRLFVDVSTSSATNLSFTVLADFVTQFQIELHTKRVFDVTPSQPMFYEFKFPEHVDMVLVKVMAEDDFCAMVAIQNITCPVFDSEENVQYGNYYQTMTIRAGITVRKVDYPNGLYVVVVVLSTDEACSSSFQHVYRIRKKTITLTIEEKITELQYLGAIFAGLGYCALFYSVAMILACISCIREKRKESRARSLLDDSLLGTTEDLGRQGTTSSCGAAAGSAETNSTASDSSLDEDDIDMLTDAESEKDIFRTKTFLYVSDLARKDMRVLTKKSQLYIWALLTVGIFYAVPVIQLVITYQRVLDETGNQDLCFYNFWCAHPLGPLTDFNHVFSNISYILFGILFMAMCARRNHHHKLASKSDYKIDKYYGIPQHFGLFYAMGGSLIMEGFLSACYHICPNNANYQFDTSFMYVISVLSMLKIYQTRHPDINASASATYAALAAAVLLGVIGVLSGTLLFWIIFGCIHVIACLLLSCQIYYMGRWKLDTGAIKRIKPWFLSEISDRRQICRPMYCDRMVLLLLGNLANWCLAIYGMVYTPRDFASYLLIIFLTNLLLYIAFYIIMKLRHGERLLLQPVVYIVLCALGWGAAVYFYTQHTTTWELTPAHSRQYNQECDLLHFYDTHDIWHFLSAGAMFFGFMLLMTLDDDLSNTPRDKIPVF